MTAPKAKKKTGRGENHTLLHDGARYSPIKNLRTCPLGRYAIYMKSKTSGDGTSNLGRLDGNFPKKFLTDGKLMGFSVER